MCHRKTARVVRAALRVWPKPSAGPQGTESAINRNIRIKSTKGDIKNDSGQRGTAFPPRSINALPLHPQ